LEAQAPQRQDLSELVYEPHKYSDYWHLAGRSVVDQASRSEDKKTVSQAISVAERMNRNKKRVDRASPHRLSSTNKGEARIYSFEAYRSLGALNTEHHIGGVAVSYACSFAGLNRHASHVETAASRLEKIDADEILGLCPSGYNSKKKMTYRNFMSSMLNEAGVYILEGDNNHRDRVIGRHLIRQSLDLIRDVSPEELSTNPQAVNEMLKRNYDIRFWELHKSAQQKRARLGGIREEFRQLQVGFINSYKEWVEQPKAEAGFAFEWLVLMAYRDYIYRHDMFDRVHIRSSFPREDYPDDEMHGGPMDNKHSHDAVLWIAGRPQHIQCKVRYGKSELDEHGQVFTSNNRNHGGMYAAPILVVTAEEAIPSVANDDVNGSGLKRKFQEHAENFLQHYVLEQDPRGYEPMASQYESYFQKMHIAA
jgi:hypothetical protein